MSKSPEPKSPVSKSPVFKSLISKSSTPKSRPRSRLGTILSQLPDCDDTLRRLADVLQVPPECRKRACRIEGQCQGGYGPPCFFARREFFSDALRDHMDEYRDQCAAHRESMRQMMRR